MVDKIRPPRAAGKFVEKCQALFFGNFCQILSNVENSHNLDVPRGTIVKALTNCSTSQARSLDTPGAVGDTPGGVVLKNFFENENVFSLKSIDHFTVLVYYRSIERGKRKRKNKLKYFFKSG